MKIWRVCAAIASVFFVFSPVFSETGALPKGWLNYADTAGNYKINYPGSWHVLTKGNAVVITSPGGQEVRGVFGITLRSDKVNMEDAVKMEFEDPNHSSDLKQSPARLGGKPAIKVWGSNKKDPSIRIVEYYVQNNSQQYYILFQAPHSSMPSYSAIFNRMITSMKFLR